jgi:uncharacterized protein
MLRALHYTLITIVLVFTAPAESALAQGPLEDLLWAARKDDVATVRVMLQRGMDVDTSDPQGNTLLITASAEGYFDLAKMLLDARAKAGSRNAYGDSALMLASLNGHLELVRLLAAYGGEVNPKGWTPLHYCAWNGKKDVCELLLELGAHVNALSDNGTTPLMMAARQGNVDVVDLLLAHKADANLSNDSGKNALSWAVEYGQDGVVKRLQARGEK